MGSQIDIPVSSGQAFQPSTVRRIVRRESILNAQLSTIARSCEELVYRAARYTDQRSWEELASLFAEEGKLIRPSDPANRIVGRDGILASLRARPPGTTRHLLSNVLVDVHAADAARISSIPVPRRLAGARMGRQGRRYILGLGSYPCQAIEGRHDSGILGERSADRRHWRSFDFLEQHNERSASS